jgi:hypothetical protein
MCWLRLSPMCTAYSAQSNLLDLIILITCGDDYKSLNSLLCYFLPPSVTSSVLCPNIFPCILSIRETHLFVN